VEALLVSSSEETIDSAFHGIEAITDSATADSADADGLAREARLQQNIESLFDPAFVQDSFALDTVRINAGRFASETWSDTARIALVDTVNDLRYALPADGYITSGFGRRRYLWHYGVDIKLYRGDSVRVAFDGVVRVTKYDRRGYGHVVVVRHRDGLETIYGHLSKKLVGSGQRVRAGEVIGLGGSSGRSTGTHLHFETRYRGEPFDPNRLVDFATGSLTSDTLVLTPADFAYLVELRKAKWCTVGKGDTLGHIALRYHTTVRKLCILNGITRTTILRIGRKLRYQ
jgi:murein DD-endopeptidase MepM/ murein hydrolase activator NlpD